MILTHKLSFFHSITPASRLLFFGSAKVALPSLIKLSALYNHLEVVTQSSKGHKKIVNEVQLYCTAHNIKWSSPISSRDDKETRKKQWNQFTEQIQGPDFGVVCSYGYMIPTKLIQKFKHGMIIVHPSLLPKYRGGAPIFHAIANGDTTSGVSYIEISPNKFDQGRVLHQVSCPIDPKATYKQVQTQLAELAAQNLPYVLDNIDILRPGKAQNQLGQNIEPHLLKAPLVLSDHLDINRPAQVVYHWSRALETPKVRLRAKDKDIIIKFHPEYLEGQCTVGTFQVQGKRLYLRCSDRFLRVKTWYQPTRSQQPPGIFIAEFIRSGKYPLSSICVQ